MATIITHPIVALALIPALRKQANWKLILIAGMLLTILPDIDVLSFRFGIPYEYMFGHRGITHSLFFSLATGLLVTLAFFYTS
jgi:inner membrane protein